MIFQLPKDMKLGVASASTQIEGGNIAHNWNDWADKGHIIDGTSPRRANEHWERYKEDIDIMSQMGIQVYRLGFEWVRLEPQPGKFDFEAVEHYRDVILYMKNLGIQPLLTLHHFSNPMWFEERGAFLKKENIPAFLDFVKFVVENFGDLVNEYVTLNEPNVYATLGYFGGNFPPGKNSVFKAFKVMSIMATCHIEAYKIIHQIRKEKGYGDTKVGFAHHMRVFEPKNPKNLWHKFCAKASERMFQSALTKACLVGKFQFPVKNILKNASGEYADFIALNYYTRNAVSSISDETAEGVEKNDLGWEIYAKGISQCAKEQYDILPRPIYITENGTCDNTDSFRALYIADHLEDLVQSNLPVQRYYHWCFTDNFEWLEGESARFGLVHVNYDTQERTIKKSGHFYSAVIKEHGVNEEIYETYLKNEQYHY